MAFVNSNQDPWARLPSVTNLEHQNVLMFRGRPRTLYLRLETVNTCNNECTICAYRDQERAKKIMPMSLFAKTARDYAEMGGGYVSLTPLVGDVFMDRHLIERVDFLNAMPEISGVGFTTNAAMAHRFSDAALSHLLRGVTRIGISVYGISPGEYAEITRRNTYDRMKQGIRRIVAFSPTPVSLEFRLFDKRTKEELTGWLRDEVFGPSEYDRLAGNMQINSVITDYANWGIYDSENTPLPRDAKWFDSARQTSRPQCLIPLFAFLVFSNGNVSFCPCDNFNDTEELRIGNVAETSLAELYASDRVRRLWDWESCGTPAFCQGCSFHIPVSLLDTRPDILSDPHQIVGAG